MVNRTRSATRPEDPRDTFTLDDGFLNTTISEPFFRFDVVVGRNRHLIFATNKQLELLGMAKTWYIDGTFKLVKKPFYQLLSIHGFVRSGDDLKQIPLCFCIMSGKNTRHYKKVFQSIKNLLPESFHFGQVLWRKLQELGLQIHDDTNEIYAQRTCTSKRRSSSWIFPPQAPKRGDIVFAIRLMMEGSIGNVMDARNGITPLALDFNKSRPNSKTKTMRYIRGKVHAAARTRPMNSDLPRPLSPPVTPSQVKMDSGYSPMPPIESTKEKNLTSLKELTDSLNTMEPKESKENWPDKTLYQQPLKPFLYET